MKSIRVLWRNRQTRIALILLAIPVVYTWPVIYLVGNDRLLANLVIVLGLLLCLLYHCQRPISNTRPGFNGRAFLPGLRLAILVTLPALLIIFFAGLRLNSLQTREHPHLDLLGLFLWAMAQQWALQTVLFDAARSHFSPNIAITLTAVSFALVHLPNPLLTGSTFLGALGWCWIYNKHPNIIPLAISHSLCSLMILASLPLEITGGMRIGYAYLQSAHWI